MKIFKDSYLLILFPLFSLTTTSVPSTADCCPASWILWGQHCYYFQFVNTEGWQDAENRCKAMALCDRPSHLASVHSREEQNFLYEVLRLAAPPESSWGPSLYIGLLVGNSQTQMSWTDGSCVDYTNWIGVEPNNAPGSVGMISNGIGRLGGWHDRSSGGLAADKYVCKMPKNERC